MISSSLRTGRRRAHSRHPPTAAGHRGDERTPAGHHPQRALPAPVHSPTMLWTIVPGVRSGAACRAVVAVSTVALAGCSSMSTIDARIERVVQQRSDDLGGGATAPTLRDRVRASYASPGMYDKQPASLNPAAGELIYEDADPDRDVLDRLERIYEVSSDALRMDLITALRIAQRSSREFITAEEEYLLAAIRLLIVQHRWSPRFFNDTSATMGSLGVDAEFDTALSLINEFRVTQRLPYGGNVEARVVTSAAIQLSQIAGEQYTQANQIILGGNVPLLRNAGLIAQEDIIQGQRDVVYAARDFERFRRQFLVSIARDYFDLIAQQSAIANQRTRLLSIQRESERISARVKAGKQAPYDARNVEQNVLSSQAALVNTQESFKLAKDRFKVRLGIPVEQAIILQPVELELADPEVTVAEAARRALLYRLDFQNRLDRIGDSRRSVANARNQLLPDLDVNAAATFRTDPDLVFGRFDYNAGDSDYNLGVTFGLPLDREIERLTLRAAIIGLERAIRDLDQFRDNIVLDARRSVREIDRARLALELADQAVQINELRLREIQIKIDEVRTQELLDAQDELLLTRDDFDRSLRDLRISILEYLLATGQMRVAPTGLLQPLQDMEVRFITRPETGMDIIAPEDPDAVLQEEPGREILDQPGAPDPGVDPDPEAQRRADEEAAERLDQQEAGQDPPDANPDRDDPPNPQDPGSPPPPGPAGVREG